MFTYNYFNLLLFALYSICFKKIILQEHEHFQSKRASSSNRHFISRAKITMKRCPVCNAPITLFTIIKALSSTRIRCPNCGRRLQFIPSGKLNLSIAVTYLLFSCLSLAFGLRLSENFTSGILTGIGVYFLICIPLVEIVVALYINRHPALQVTCVQKKIGKDPR